MIKRIDDEKLPIKLWMDNLEPGAERQARNLANLPFAFMHIAIMPDAHEGYGMPIGGVLATKGVVIPNAVGVDIGCGMCAVRTSVNDLSISKIKRIMSKIRERIPLGFEHHKHSQDEKYMPKGYDVDNMTVVSRQYKAATKQVGTLGGGNHFIELQKGSDGFIWIMIHSGSRNIGKQVADYYNRIAENLNRSIVGKSYKSQELAYLPFESKEANDYFLEMQYCVDFALCNRKLMMELVKESILEEVSTNFGDMFNIAHNYAVWEKHFGENVIVHRKGATSAKQGEVGIIPGSQGTKSYIVEGKGNPDSFQSCSHGAGRKLGRNQARKQLDLSEEIKFLEQRGIIHSIRNEKDLDEAAGAYKDINEVMNNQSDLVSILVELSPLAVIKG